MAKGWINKLYFGDNLEVLRRHVDEESVDLIYLDPPFKSNQDYNVLFAEHGTRSAAQIKAFEDTWHWDETAAGAYQEIVETGGRVAVVMLAFKTFLGDSDMMAYLSMMAPRLVELQRVLKTTGSLYLHCDPTASHYLKMLLDAVFGPKFRPQYNRDDPDYQRYIDESFNMVDEDGRKFQATSLTNPAYRPNLIYEYKGYKPPRNGWMITKDKMELWDREGRIYFPPNKEGRLRRKSYVDELKGMPIQNLWTDIGVISSHAAERLGYPTQKPEALLERILKSSSNEGDLVLDPFCGCGTTIAVAHRLKRRWIGIDITHLAINLLRHRLREDFGDKVEAEFEVIGEPKDLEGAMELAGSDPYQFQFWSLGLVGARPVEQKKGADRGIDGRLFFHDSKDGKTKQIIISVKAGKNIGAKEVRDLRGVIERERVEIGVLISMNEPTRPMRKEAADAGFYTSTAFGKFPRLQLLTTEELLAGHGIKYPTRQGNITFKRASKTKTATKTAGPMFDGQDSEDE